MTKKTLLIVALGIIIRFVLSITTYHQDLGAISLSSKYIIVDHRYTDFYDMSNQDANKTVFNYQPLAYLIPSAIYSPFSKQIKDTAEQMVNRDWINDTHPNYSFLLILYKLPALIFDLAILFLLPKIFTGKREKNLSVILWSLNPIAIYVSSIMGQVDMIICFFILASFALLKQKKYLWASLFIALSALIKPIGMILLPLIFLEACFDRKVLKSLGSLVVGVGVYILGILPFISSPGYRYYALFADQINKSLYAGIQISANTFIPLFFISLLIFYLLRYRQVIDSTVSFIGIMLSALVFTHFHPQWVVWVTPILIYLSIKEDSYLLYSGIVLSWFTVLMSFDDTLFLGSFLNPFLSFSTTFRNSNIFRMVEMFARSYLVCYLLLLANNPQNSKDSGK